VRVQEAADAGSSSKMLPFASVGSDETDLNHHQRRSTASGRERARRADGRRNVKLSSQWGKRARDVWPEKVE
jgi:hypothetical protein